MVSLNDPDLPEADLNFEGVVIPPVELKQGQSAARMTGSSHKSSNTYTGRYRA